MGRSLKLSVFLLIWIPAIIFAQEKNITGTVYDSTNFPLSDVEVSVQGTDVKTVTDIDGKYSISASKGDVLEFYSPDYTLFTANVGETNTINASLRAGVNSLNEVVAVGYGTFKKEDLTSAISIVDPENLAKTPTSQVTQALQGQVAGVQISSTGSPGDSPEINIRGRNSLYGNTTPLYVVDGMFYRNIDFLDASQIESMAVLKDASSSAIYGVRAANGVIVITTKGGGFNRPSKITYNGYYGFQRAQNVIQMANTEQFTNFALESGSASEIASIASAMQRFGRSRINPNVPAPNTDWYKETLRAGAVYNQNISIEGGSDRLAYAVGGTYFSQTGILAMKNQYSRYDLTARVDAKAKTWLNVGANILYSSAKKYNAEQSAWRQIYFAVPVMPKYDDTYTNAYPGPYADAQTIGYRGHQNPFSLMDNSNLKGTRGRINASAYLDFLILPNKLNFKSSFNYTNVNDNNRLVYLPYYVSDSYQRSVAESSITRSTYNTENYIWDNVLTYHNKWGGHDVTIMGGTSFRSEDYSNYGVTGNFDPNAAFIRDNMKTWYIQNTTASSRTSFDGGQKFYGSSVFGRLSYQYNDKYLAYVTVRNEGSNKYDQKYVTLPAFGVGWVMSKENFMRGAKGIDFLKLRGSWGRLANDAVPRNRPATASSTQTVFNDAYVTGNSFSTYSDKLSWEYTDETNIGLSSKFLRNRLSIELDYFDKNTNNLAIPVLPQIGTAASYANVGKVKNSGFETELGWNHQLNKNFNYYINANFSTLKNEVRDLKGQPYLLRGTAEYRQVLAVGQPMDVFWGWQVDGVYQNAAEIAADPTTAGLNIKPGYFKYRDVNDDGVIDDKDRVYLGSGVPKFYFGGTLGFTYKSWGFNFSYYGQSGNKVLMRNRMEVIWTQGNNIDADLAKNRWHGEGTSNSYMSSEGYRNSWNQKLSNFWLQKGNFFRIQNIQLSYTLKTIGLPDMRFTFTADRPFQWSKKFVGMNPEVGFSGIDFQTYPTPSTYSFGYSITF